MGRLEGSVSLGWFICLPWPRIRPRPLPIPRRSLSPSPPLAGIPSPLSSDQRQPCYNRLSCAARRWGGESSRLCLARPRLRATGGWLLASLGREICSGRGPERRAGGQAVETDPASADRTRGEREIGTPRMAPAWPRPLPALAEAPGEGLLLLLLL